MGPPYSQNFAEKQPKISLLLVLPCDIVDQLQGSFGPFGPKSEKSLERGSQASDRKLAIFKFFFLSF